MNLVKRYLKLLNQYCKNTEDNGFHRIERTIPLRYLYLVHEELNPMKQIADCIWKNSLTLQTPYNKTIVLRAKIVNPNQYIYRY